MRRSLQRWLSATITLTVFGVVVAVVVWTPPTPPASGVPLLDPDPSRDWPMLGGTQGRNMVNTLERGIPHEWDVETGKNVKWVARIGTRAFGGPMVAGGRVFVGTNNQSPHDFDEIGDRGVLMCFRESDGAFLWQAVHRKLESGIVNDWPQEGICSTPTADHDRLYYVSNRGELVCADILGSPGTARAKTLWKLDMPRELGVFPHNMSNGSPLVVGNMVYASTSNGVDEGHMDLPSPWAPCLVAVHKRTGKVLWKTNAPGKAVMHGQWASPAYADVGGKRQVIYPAGDGWLYSFDALTGKLIWKFDANPKDSKYELGGKGTKSDFIACPVVVGDRCYIGTGQDPEHLDGVGHLWCIDITKDGDVSPELVVNAQVSPPRTKPNPNSAAVWHYGGLVKKEDQERMQKEFYFGRTMSAVAVHDDLVYAVDLPGFFYCLDARTGKLHYYHDLKAGSWGSPYWVDGKIYVATEDGDVCVFAHGKEKKLLSRAEMGRVIRTTPVAANGVLYILTESHLFAIAKK
jgi:outer membrane protein assembly factor BamB